MNYVDGSGSSSASGTATAITETSGPTTLTVGAIADGQFTKRSGSTFVGVTEGIFDPTNPAITGGTVVGLTKLGVRDTSAAFDAVIAATSSTPLTAEHKLTLDLVNADRTLKVSGNAEVSGTNTGGNTGDQTITLTGNVTGSGKGSFATTIAAGAVSLAMMTNLAANSIIGNNTGSPATPIALTVANVKSLLAYVPADILSGSGIVWDATNLTLALGSAATSVNSSLAILASKTIAVPAALSVWRGLDIQASTLTLAAGGVAPNSLSLAYIAAPTITSAAAYTIPSAATVTIAGAPIAGAGTTITLPMALDVQSGISMLHDSVGIGVNGLATPSFGSPSTAITLFGGGSGHGDSISWAFTSAGGPTYTSMHSYNGGLFLYGGGGGSLGVVFTVQSVLPSVADCFTVCTFPGASSTSVGIGARPLANETLCLWGTKTIASAAGAVWNGFHSTAITLSITGNTAITTASGFNNNTFNAPTIVGDTATCAISQAATVYIDGAPIAGLNVTIAKPYSLWIDSGLPRIDSTSANGSVAVVLGAIGPAGANTTVQEWLTIDINGTTRYIPCF